MTLRYIVILRKPQTGKIDVFDTDLCPKSMFNPETTEAIIDTHTRCVTYDGEEWLPMEYDHL